MRRHDGPASDAMVDVYRAIIAGKSDIAAKPVTPGAGVDPRKVCKPSKRLRNWHRATHDRDHMSLRQWARMVVSLKGEESNIAQRWLTSKGIKP